jgi:hypothetical protein
MGKKGKETVGLKGEKEETNIIGCHGVNWHSISSMEFIAIQIFSTVSSSYLPSLVLILSKQYSQKVVRRKVKNTG